MKYLIFDFDGTLVDNLPQVFELLRQNLLSKGIDLNDYSLEDLRQIGVKNFMKKIKVSKLELFKIYKNIKRDIREHLESFSPVSELESVLPVLSQKYQLIIFTSNSKTAVISYLKKYKLDKYFSNIYEDNSYFGKDIGIKKIVKTLKTSPSNVVYIGDETRDIEAAKKAGIVSVAVTWGYEGDIPLSAVNPDYLANKPEELINLKF